MHWFQITVTCVEERIVGRDKKYREGGGKIVILSTLLHKSLTTKQAKEEEISKQNSKQAIIQGRRGRGMWMIIAKVAGKCDISHFPREYVLVKATHLALLRLSSMPVYEVKTQQRPLHWRKWNRCPVFLADGMLEPKVKMFANPVFITSGRFM